MNPGPQGGFSDPLGWPERMAKDPAQDETAAKFRNAGIRSATADELVRVYKENPWLGASAFSTIMNTAAVEHLERIYALIQRRKQAMADEERGAREESNS